MSGNTAPGKALVGFYAPEPLRLAIKAAAERQGVNVSEYLRRALAEHLAQEPEGSAAA